MKPRVATSIHGLNGVPMFGILARCKELEAKGVYVRHFELGDPDFATPENVVSAGVESLRAGNTHYCPSRGDHQLIGRIADDVADRLGFKPTHDQITITTGANSAIFYALRTLCDPGDEVLVPDPYFPTYPSAARLAYANCRFYPLRQEEGYLPRSGYLEQYVTARTRALILNSPSNPTGAVFPEATIRELYTFAEKHDLFIISDEIYSRMNHRERSSCFSPGMVDLCRERTLVVTGFSKSHAMTGWRVGAIIAPHDISDKITLVSESIVSCVPGFIQDAAVAALELEEETTQSMYQEYRLRQQLLVAEFRKVPGMGCSLPDAGMYVFASIRGITNDSERFAYHLLNEAHIASTPGIYFGSEGEGHLRFSCTSNGAMIQGIGELIRDAAAKFD